MTLKNLCSGLNACVKFLTEVLKIEHWNMKKKTCLCYPKHLLFVFKKLIVKMGEKFYMITKKQKFFLLRIDNFLIDHSPNRAFQGQSNQNIFKWT